MKLHARSVVWLLPFFLAGCFHIGPIGRKQSPPPVAPAIDVGSKSAPPAIEHPPLEATIPGMPLASGAAAHPVPKSRPRMKHRKPASSNSEQAVAAPQQAPANSEQAAAESPAVSAIGQLSTGDSPDKRQQTVDSISATERSLNGIGGTLSDPEQKTAAQIREYLKKAREALASGDVDGAHTLAAKAKLLLGELGR